VRAKLLALIVIALSILPGTSSATEWTPLIERLRGEAFDEARLKELYSHPAVRFDPRPMTAKVKAFLKKRDVRSPEDPVRPRRAAPYRRCLKAGAIAAARDFKRNNREVLEKIKKRYCVPPEVVVSVLLVETRLGENVGRERAFVTLSSMALASDFDLVRPHLSASLRAPDDEAYARAHCRAKGEWAYNELVHLLRYAEESGRDPLNIPGSPYGAIGLCQFMPSNVGKYGVDTQGKGYPDPFETADALHSIANYLSRRGWTCRSDHGQRYRAVWEYNHSHSYVATVLAVAERLRDRGKGSGKVVQVRKRERGASS